MKTTSTRRSLKWRLHSDWHLSLVGLREKGKCKSIGTEDRLHSSRQTEVHDWRRRPENARKRTEKSHQIAQITSKIQHERTDDASDRALFRQFDELSGPAAEHNDIGLLLIVVRLVHHVKHHCSVVAARRPHNGCRSRRAVCRHGLLNSGEENTVTVEPHYVNKE